MKISIHLLNLVLGVVLLVGGGCQGESEVLTQVSDETIEDATPETPEANTASDQKVEEQEPVQSGPFIDLFGTKLQSLELVDEKSAQIKEVYTNEALSGKKVVGVYFSADWYASSMCARAGFLFARFFLIRPTSFFKYYLLIFFISYVSIANTIRCGP